MTFNMNTIMIYICIYLHKLITIYNLYILMYTYQLWIIYIYNYFSLFHISMKIRKYVLSGKIKKKKTILKLDPMSNKQSLHFSCQTQISISGVESGYQINILTYSKNCILFKRVHHTIYYFWPNRYQLKYSILYLQQKNHRRVQ